VELLRGKRLRTVGPLRQAQDGRFGKLTADAFDKLTTCGPGVFQRRARRLGLAGRSFAHGPCVVISSSMSSSPAQSSAAPDLGRSSPARRRRRILWTAAGAVLVLLVAGAAAALFLRSTTRCPDADRRCSKNLSALFQCVDLYAQERKGALPPSIDAALDNLATSRSVFYHCSPGEQFDYAYIDWSARYTRDDLYRANLPVLFERRLDHHATRGVNVLLADGSVFWDADAAWLRRFAIEHPDIKVELAP
jgi:prepilin-type processing-associated H-X9-DG protein